jgi:DNA-binding transcriptional MerR regulator
MNRYTAEELVNIVNSKISFMGLAYNDSRTSKELTERRLRDYVYKGLVSPPLRDGRNSFFNDKHIEEVLQARVLNIGGYTDSVISKTVGDRESTSSMLRSVSSSASLNTNDETNDEDKTDETLDDVIYSLRKDALLEKNTEVFSNGSIGLTKAFLATNGTRETHYISEDGSTYIKFDKNKVKEIKEDEVEEATKNCSIKIDLTNK